MADKKEKYADDDAGANLRPGGAKTSCQAPDEENRAGNQVSGAGGVKRRNRFHGVTNRKVGGSPDDVNGKKRNNNRDAMSTGNERRGGWEGSSFDDVGARVGS